VSRKTLWILVGAIVLIAAAGIGYYLTSGSSSDSTSAGAGYELVPTDRGLGNRNAKVVLIEYGAPSCPVCANFNANTFPQVKAKYIDSGKVYYVFRVFPLRSDDGMAEKIARCLPEDKYLPFIDLLFKNQAKWDVEFSQVNPAVATPEGVHQGLVLLGRIAGMSAEQVDQCMVNKAEDDRINKVASEGEARYSINSTPTFILNGVKIGSGNLAFDTVSKLLDAELAKQH
jgi:protein-disulfide isomerase